VDDRSAAVLRLATKKGMLGSAPLERRGCDKSNRQGPAAWEGEGGRAGGFVICRDAKDAMALNDADNKQELWRNEERREWHPAGRKALRRHSRLHSTQQP
jgi:hypothetical protein